MLLRHISFVVETRRGRPAGLGNYLCYLFFYPSFIGASEIYSEFHERNLSGGVYDYRFAGYKIVTGQLLLWVALQFTLPFEQVIQIRQPLTLWLSVLASLLLSGLFVMGLWSTIEGLALLYGIRLRPNFPAVLTCTNPAEFWRAWRATMTNWLIHYVYIPLFRSAAIAASSCATSLPRSPSAWRDTGWVSRSISSAYPPTTLRPSHCGD